MECRKTGTDVHGKNWNMLMNTQCSQCILCGIDCVNRHIHSQIPQSNLAIPTARYQLSHSASLHVYVRNPLLMFSPHFNHSNGGLQALIEYSNRAVSESSNENIARNLVRSQRRDART